MVNLFIRRIYIFGGTMGYIQRKRKGAVAHVYFQLYDGSFWEGDSQGLTCDERGTVRDDDCNSLCDLFHTDASIKNFDSIKQIKELLESNSDDFFEKIINPETYKPTALGARIIRNIVPNEESVNRLYRSLITIEKRAEWFDVSKIFWLFGCGWRSFNNSCFNAKRINKRFNTQKRGIMCESLLWWTCFRI